MGRHVGISAITFALACGLGLVAGSGTSLGGPARALASSPVTAGASVGSAAKQAKACSLRKTSTSCFSVTSLGRNAWGTCNFQFTGTGLQPNATVYDAPPTFPTSTQPVYDTSNLIMTVPSSGILNDVAAFNPPATVIFEVQSASGTTLTTSTVNLSC